MKYRIREIAPGLFRVEQKGGLWWAPAIYGFFGGGYASEFRDVAAANAALDRVIASRNHKPRNVREVP